MSVVTRFGEGRTRTIVDASGQAAIYSPKQGKYNNASFMFDVLAREIQ